MEATDTYARWVYAQPNPKRRKTGDCVIRAISLAENRPWGELLAAMTAWLIPRGDVFDEKSGFSAYLKHIGYERIPSSKNPQTGKYWKIGEIVPRFFRWKHLLIQTRNHLTYARDGIVYDTFDCRDRVAYTIWARLVRTDEKLHPLTTTTNKE